MKHKGAEVRQAIFVYLATRGASYEDLATLTGYTKHTVHVMVGRLDAYYDGLRAIKNRPIPIAREVVGEYNWLTSVKRMSALDAAKLVMSVED